MAEVAFCDSTGMQALLAARTAMLGRGRTVRLVAPGQQLARLLRITGLEQIFGVYPDRQTALRALTER